MCIRKFNVLGLAGLAGLTALAACSAPETAPDVAQFEDGVRIFKADTIYTGNPDEPQISGLAVNKDGIIVATFPLGYDAHAQTPSGPAERITFEGGRGSTQATTGRKAIWPRQRRASL